MLTNISALFERMPCFFYACMHVCMYVCMYVRARVHED
jgi:hypothetical protein